VIAHVLLIFMAATEAGSATSQALLRALGEALGPAAHVTLQGVPSPPSDDALVQRVKSDQATAAVRLVWDNPSRVVLHVYVAKGEESYDQRLAFQASDPAEERGRALGFVIASYLLPPVPRAAAVVAAVRPPQEPRWALEGFGVGAVALEGYGGGVGGAFGVRWSPSERWGLRAGFSLRSGYVLPAQAASLNAAGSLGLFRVIAAGQGPHRFALAIRADALLFYDTLTHLSSNHPVALPAMRRAKMLPGVAAVAELEWRLATAAALHLGLGFEEAFGVTPLWVEGKQEGEIGRSRAVAEVGFRTRF
jgi:hypothetical protein